MPSSMHRGHNSLAKPDEQMGRSIINTSTQKSVTKRRAAKKRRQRDRKMVDQHTWEVS